MKLSVALFLLVLVMNLVSALQAKMMNSKPILVGAKTPLITTLYPTDGTKNSVNIGISLSPSDYKYYSLSGSHLSYRPISDLTSAQTYWRCRYC